MAFDDVPVTIIGGGPVGMSMAIALARQGVASRVIELSTSTTDHPKARGVWPRAMEIFRQWGVSEPIRARGLPDHSDSMVLVETLDEIIDRTRPEPFNDESPARKSIVAQDAVEEALAAKLADFSAIDMRWSTEFVRAEEEADGVLITASRTDGGSEESWRSTYLIGAYGASNIVARQLQVEYDGPPVLATMLNTYFRADLSRYDCVRDAAGLYMRAGPEGEAINLLNTNGRDRWLWLQRIGTTQDDRPRPLTEAETIARIRRALRLPDLKIEIINEAVWRMTRRIAQRFRHARLFLVGDAAHRFPPFGGFGMNSGIQDVHNLAWKMAFALRGLAGDALLDSYDVERRPIAHANADLAMVNMARYPHMQAALQSGNRDRIRFWLNDAENHIHSIGHTLGFVYEQGALVPDGTTPPPQVPRYYTPTDRPGSRFPHFWLDDRTRSSLDLFDRDLVLMVGPDAEAWAQAAASVSDELALPIEVHRLRQEDLQHGLAMGTRGAALVRPDGITAWRIGWTSDDPAGELKGAVRAVIGRGVDEGLATLTAGSNTPETLARLAPKISA